MNSLLRQAAGRCWLACFFVALGTSAVAEVSAVDGRGKRVTLKETPKRIVSLSPGTTEMLFALGLKGRIVADTSYCDYPPEARKLPHIGDVSVSAEQVIAQNPDLVVASGSANRTAIASLEKLDVPVFAVDPSSFDGTYTALRQLGAITGQSRQAEDLVARMKQSLARIRAQIPRANSRPKILWVIQVDPLIVVGRGNFMDDLITLAGAENVGRSAGVGWPSFSPEQLLLLRPDVVLSGRETASRVRSRSGWEEVPAVAKRRVYTLSSEEAVRPGPRLTDALAQLVSLLYPTKPQQPTAPR